MTVNDSPATTTPRIVATTGESNASSPGAITGSFCMPPNHRV